MSSKVFVFLTIVVTLVTMAISFTMTTTSTRALIGKVCQVFLIESMYTSYIYIHLTCMHAYWIFIGLLQRSSLSMEYVPEGLTKAQWQAIQKKEKEEALKKRNEFGTNRFQSRSFEAWQKAGAVHLFPVGM